MKSSQIPAVPLEEALRTGLVTLTPANRFEYNAADGPGHERGSGRTALIYSVTNISL